jgi:hypothetical protein
MLITHTTKSKGRFEMSRNQTRNHNSNIPLHLVPAYGRDYKTSTEALAAWREGKDFRIMDISSPYNRAYCSCRDFTRVESVLIRYNRRANFVITGGLKKHPPRSGTLAIAALLILSAIAPARAFCILPSNADSATQMLYQQCQNAEQERDHIKRSRPPLNYLDCMDWAFQSSDPGAIYKCHHSDY